MTNDEFRENFFDGYSEQGDDFCEEWFEAFFKRALRHGDPADMDLEWEAEGGESDKLFVFDDGDGISYWTQSSAGVQGPFEAKEEAVDALGYDPDSFPPDGAEDADEVEVADEDGDVIVPDDEDDEAGEDFDEDEDDEEEEDWDEDEDEDEED